jgi:metal-sulfur cluster biosynthetic enzyme
MATHNDEAARVRGLLRSVHHPGFQRDIVVAGFLKDIEVEGTRVAVHFAPNARDQAKAEQLEADIRDPLRGAGRSASSAWRFSVISRSQIPGSWIPLLPGSGP